MNERIKELAEQAEWWKPLGLPSNWDEGDYVVSPEQLKKLTGLIVRECIQSIEKTIDSNCETDAEKIGCEIAIIDLIEHFGVE